MADPRDLEQVRSLLSTRKEELIRTYGAEGVGIGRNPSGDGYAIVIYIAKASPAVPGETFVEGVPVVLASTGKFRAQS